MDDQEKDSQGKASRERASQERASQEMGSQEKDSQDELAALVDEFASRRTYRPADGMAEPDELPQGPSGTAMGEAAEPEAP